jgi:hypothetical protein
MLTPLRTGSDVATGKRALWPLQAMYPICRSITGNGVRRSMMLGELKPHLFSCALEAPAEAVNREVFNVGSTRENHRVRWTAKMGAKELRRLFERIEMSPATYEFRTFTWLKQVRYLRRTKQVDAELYWSKR